MAQPRQPPPRFDSRTVYRAWAASQPHRRWERQDGLVVAMAPERLRHTRIKANAWAALRLALATIGSTCEAIIDGVTVEIGDGTDYEPDVVVNCGDRADDLALAAPTPVVIVEVLSPSTAQRDTTSKLADYFRLPSLRHYLLVSTDTASVVCHTRVTAEGLLTSVHARGTIPLDPPGILIAVADLYAGTDFAPNSRGADAVPP